ncbi:hypothetical protein SAMN04489724_3322 [Algoriphagus locisalis]|uniref:Uncharacterized protein n=1 Tax=Algoriphagus locisalis TaxID=305507 RepID=A0A1I7CQI2_9BACT|nr:hypothetical protein SAMN04489724_3322 [Algoriphagus locisalis]
MQPHNLNLRNKHLDRGVPDRQGAQLKLGSYFFDSKNYWILSMNLFKIQETEKHFTKSRPINYNNFVLNDFELF